jgi:peptidyl-prolyl cis-trans isomerase SurA
MKKIINTTIILMVVTILPLFARGEEIDRISAVVNDEIITSYEVSQSADNMAREADKKGTPSDLDRAKLKKTALDNLINKKLIDQKIIELNINVSDDELRQTIDDVKKQNNLTQENLIAALRTQGLTLDQYKAQLREQLERVRLMGQEVRSKIQVNEQEVKDYYNANPKSFGGDDLFHARHIFFRLPADAKPEDVNKVLTRAMIVLQKAQSGDDFAELAKKFSDDPQAATDGGDLGTFKKGDMLPEIEAAVIDMKSGQVSSIVNTKAGFHIIKLVERKQGEVKPFSDVKGAIEEMLYRKKSEERFNQWVEELRRVAAIEIMS